MRTEAEAIPGAGVISGVPEAAEISGAETAVTPEAEVIPEAAVTPSAEPLHEGQRSFRSQVSYVNLVGVLIGSALLIVIWSSRMGAAIFAVIGIAWVALTLRSVIAVTDEGFTVRGLFRTRHLSWSETDAFIVVGFSGTSRRLLRSSADCVAPVAEGQAIVGLSLEAIETEALSARAPLFSVVAVVSRRGERFRVHGTASTPLDRDFPAEAAAELNRRLKQHNPSATAC